MVAWAGKEVVARQGEHNLLKNAGAEKGAGGVPDGWDQGATIDGVEYIWHAKIGHSGHRSLCLKKTAQRYFPIAQWGQTFACKAGAKHLKVGAWVKARQVTKAILDVQFEDSNGQPLGHNWVAYIGAKDPSEPPADHDWKRFGDTVDIPEGTAQVTVAPQIYGPGVVWFDDLTAEYAP